MPKPRPLKVRIQEAREKLERLKDLEQLERIKDRMKARQQAGRRGRRRF